MLEDSVTDLAVRSGRRAPRVVVVGAGFSGLAAAYELACSGLQPIVMETESEVGGLAASFQIDGSTRLERFYHHWFTSDQT
jgi:protoporphyrinogen oxidase